MGSGAKAPAAGGFNGRLTHAHRFRQSFRHRGGAWRAAGRAQQSAAAGVRAVCRAVERDGVHHGARREPAVVAVPVAAECQSWRLYTDGRCGRGAIAACQSQSLALGPAADARCPDRFSWLADADAGERRRRGAVGGDAVDLCGDAGHGQPGVFVGRWRDADHPRNGSVAAGHRNGDHRYCATGDCRHSAGLALSRRDSRWRRAGLSHREPWRAVSLARSGADRQQRAGQPARFRKPGGSVRGPRRAVRTHSEIRRPIVDNDAGAFAVRCRRVARQSGAGEI